MQNVCYRIKLVDEVANPGGRILFEACKFGLMFLRQYWSTGWVANDLKSFMAFKDE